MTSQEITSAWCRVIGPADDPSKLWKTWVPICSDGPQSYLPSVDAPRLLRATAVDTGLNVEPGALEPWYARDSRGMPLAGSDNAL